MIAWLSRLLRPAPPPARLPSHLSEAEALRIARAALGPAAPHLVTHGPHQAPGGLEWRVTGLVIGAAPFVRIDDATGTVLESGRHHAR